jgi:hypothetical protein
MNPQDPYERLRGKRFIAIVRCSTLGQADTSIPDQLRLVREFAQRYGLFEVEIISLDGLSGSIPGNREDLDLLLKRKREKDDFDVVLLQDTTRLTRGGLKHGNHVEYLFAAAGIEIVFVLEQMVSGTAGELYKSFQYYAANEQARNIAKSGARGSMSAIERGELSHTRRPPFAVDRMYVGYDGRPRHVVRNLADGTQLKLDPTSGAIVERMGLNPKTGKPARYVKQNDETVRLVLGESGLVEAVRAMFRRHLVDGWGGWRIAAELESMHIPSPIGKRWNKNSVLVILRNPIYTGIGIANRLASGLYYNRAAGAPREATQDAMHLDKCKRPKTTLRPSEEWKEIAQPALKNFLPSDLRELAIAYQTRYWSSREEHRALPKRNRHIDSPYFLSELLRSKQGGQPITGKTCGPKGHKVRYYMVKQAMQCPMVDNPLWRRMVRADVLEPLMLRLLQQTLLAAPNLKTVLRKQIARRFADTEAKREQEAVLSARRLKLQRQRSFMLGNIDVIGEVEARQQLAEIKQELDQLDRQLVDTITSKPWDERRVEQTVNELIGQLRQTADVLRSVPRATLRRMLELLVEKLEVDLATGAVKVTFGLPDWAIQTPQRLGYELCLKAISEPKDGRQAQRVAGLRLVRYRILWLGRNDGYIGYGVAA